MTQQSFTDQRLVRFKNRVITPRFLVPLAGICLVAFVALVPLIFLVDTAFFVDGKLGIGHFVAAFTLYNGLELTLNTLLFTAGSTIIAVGLGATMAYLAVKTDVPLKSLLYAAALVPLVIPGILYTISWIFLGSPGIGIFNTLLPEGTLNIYSLGGMILVEGLNLSPVTFLMMYAALRSIDPALEEAAYSAGAPMRVVVRKITAPLMWPGFFGASLITIVRAIESFEVPAILGIPAGEFVFTSQIFRNVKSFPTAYGEASVYGLALVVFAAALIYWESRINRNAKAFQTITGKGHRSRTFSLGLMRWPIGAMVVVYFVIAVALPLLVLLLQSTQPYFAVPSLESLGRISLANYIDIFTSPRVIRAMSNSLLLGLGATSFVMLTMAIIAWVVAKTELPGRWLLDNLAFVPLAVPGVVLGLGVLVFYLRVPLPIYGTLWILFIAYFTKYMPYGIRYVQTSMRQVSKELEDAAATSGASWWESFRRITLPLIMPGFVAGWIFIFILSIRELSVSILLYSPNNEVLAVIIWEDLANGNLTHLSALGVIMIAIAAILVPIARRLGSRTGMRV